MTTERARLGREMVDRATWRTMARSVYAPTRSATPAAIGHRAA